MAFDPTDPDTKAAIASAVAEANAAIEKKNDELLGEVKKLKTDLRKTQDINPDEFAALESERDTLKAKLTATEKLAKDAQTAADKATKALEAESGVTHKLLAENGLIAELTKAGISDPDFLAAAKAMHIGGVKVVVEGEDRKAMLGDKTVADAIKEWAATDTAKKFIAAPVNTGGGLGGGKGGAGGKIASQEAINAMTPKERAGFFAEGGAIAA